MQLKEEHSGQFDKGMEAELSSRATGQRWSKE